MVFRFLGYLRKVFRVFIDILNVKMLKKYPILYFDGVANVGDLINPYLVKRLAEKPCHQVRSKTITHAICLGSMFHMANNKSVIWGTGVISNAPEFAARTSCHSVNAVRGALTKKVLIDNNVNLPDDLVLGDPGVLMPLYYAPNVSKSRKVAVIPHYVDQDFVLSIQNNIIHIIDVSQPPEKFIDELLSCEFVLSSSLHGLILSDTYGIPNKWISFSGKITGGGFKFYDYYSTTDSPDEDCIFVEDESELIQLVKNIESISSIKGYVFDKQALIDSFPML